MMAADGLPPLRDVIARHDLAAKKSLGQNFLLDLNLTGRIARSAGDLTQCTVIEIGPGPGGLTRALLANSAKKVIAVERDERCLPALAEIAAHYPDRLQVIAGDAMTAFTPPPKVTSSVVQLVPRAHPEPCNIHTLSRVTAAAFGQRRKMLRQSLKALGTDPLALLAAVGIDPTLRAETVPVEGFVALSRAFDALHPVKSL